MVAQRFLRAAFELERSPWTPHGGQDTSADHSYSIENGTGVKGFPVAHLSGFRQFTIDDALAAMAAAGTGGKATIAKSARRSNAGAFRRCRMKSTE